MVSLLFMHSHKNNMSNHLQLIRKNLVGDFDFTIKDKFMNDFCESYN